MSFGINAENLATEGLALEIAGGSGDIRIVLGQSGGVTGRYEQDAGRIGLREISAHQLSLQTLVLPIAGGTLRVDPPTILAALWVDAELGGGRPFTGRVTLASAGMHVSFERGPLVARARIGLRGTRYERSELAGQRAEIESVEVEALRLQLQGGVSVEVEQLSLRGVVCVVEPSGAVVLRCGAARAGALLLEQGGRVIRVRGVAWPHGLELQGEALRWPELALDRLQLVVPELPPRASSPAPAAAPRAERPALDLPALDYLEGLLALDLFVDIRIPILPDRKATHSIRLPISQGTINFKQLEGCLAHLEDALLDFEVNEQGLILELDPIPGVTFDNVTLVTWPLAGPEHELARTQQRIRLRRLLDYQLSPKLAGSGAQREPRGESPSALRRLHLADIDTVLKLGGPFVQHVPGLGMLRLGSPGQAAVGELKLSGQLEHTPGRPASASELRLDAHEVSLGASLAVAGGRAEIERLTIRQIDGARLGLQGLEPRSFSADAAGLHVGRVELRGWFGRASSA